MVKFRLYSDTHLDGYAHASQQKQVMERYGSLENLFWFPEKREDEKDTTLILAGDLWVGTKFINWGTFSWISIVAPRFKQVLIVLGNHDYWPQGNLSILDAATKCNNMLQDMALFNVKVLDCDTFELDDILFVGATLWTDIFRGSPLAMMNLDKSMSHDGKISYKKEPFRKFTPELWIQTHDKHKKYIENIAQNNRDKKIVVVTHHVPLNHVGDPLYNGNDLNAYYHSDLSNLILDNENIIAWCFGHTHHHVDEVFGQCRVLNNSVGYISEHAEDQGLVNHDCYEV